MRNPDRIDRILGLIKARWEKTPDQRLGQLLENILGSPINWFLEDDMLEDDLRGETALEIFTTEPSWKTADGIIALVHKLDDDHILNIIGYCFRMNRVPMDAVREAAKREILKGIVREGGLTRDI